MLSRTICAAILWSLAACGLYAQSEIEKLGRPYVDKRGEINATLTYWRGQTETTLIFKAAGASGGLPPFEAQCERLDRLLGRVLDDHPEEKTFDIALSSMQEYFVQRLQHFVAISPGWDSALGRPRQGRKLGEFLTDALNKSGILDPVARLFDRHKMSLSASGMNRIEIEKIPGMNGARLPAYIWEIHFTAKKL